MSDLSTQETEDLFSAVLELAVSPVVSNLSVEAMQPIDIVAIAFPPSGQPIEKRLHVTSLKVTAGIVARGEVRILLKGDRYPCSFEVEAIFKELSPGTGFSGFAMRGKIKLENGGPHVNLTAYSNRYNVWEWGRNFRGV